MPCLFALIAVLSPRLAVLLLWLFTPWVDKARIDREGMAIICPSDFLHCLADIKRYAPDRPRTDITVTRKWLGFESPPEKFTIAILPPK